MEKSAWKACRRLYQNISFSIFSHQDVYYMLLRDSSGESNQRLQFLLCWAHSGGALCRCVAAVLWDAHRCDFGSHSYKNLRRTVGMAGNKVMFPILKGRLKCNYQQITGFQSLQFGFLVSLLSWSILASCMGKPDYLKKKIIIKILL